jgi:hypothetical protein
MTYEPTGNDTDNLASKQCFTEHASQESEGPRRDRRHRQRPPKDSSAWGMPVICY